MMRRTVKLELAFNGAISEDDLKYEVEETVTQMACDIAASQADDRYSVEITWEDAE